MVLRRAQRGMTLIGLIIVLMVVGFFLYLGMTLFPMYSEYRGVVEAMNSWSVDPNVRDKSPGDAWTLLERRLSVSYVDSVQREHFKIDKRTGTASVAYEVRKPFIYNLDMVGKFEYSVEIGK